MPQSSPYEGIFKYKIFQLFVLFFTLITVVVGPYLYPNFAYGYYLFWAAVTLYKISEHLYSNICAYRDFHKVLKETEDSNLSLAD